VANFTTAQFDQPVASLKKLFETYPDLYTHGQFHITNHILNGILNAAKLELDSNIRLKFAPQAVREQIMGGLRGSIEHIPVAQLNVPALNALLGAFEVQGDFAAIHERLNNKPPGAAEASAVLNAYNHIWSKPTLPTGIPYGILRFDIQTARAAYAFEKDKCFTTCRSFADKVLAKRQVSKLARNLQISNGMIAGATFTGKPSVPGPLEEPQTITYKAPAQLESYAQTMRLAINAGAVVQCGVLSGVRGAVNQQPEHYLLAFAHGDVDGQKAFLFWDPDAQRSNLGWTNWGPGFGVLFSRPGHLCTAVDDSDLSNIDRDKNSLTFGDHQSEKRRHCYQVFYIQTLPP
jgi:hypothetical protein